MTTLPDGSAPPQSDLAAKWYPEIAARDQGAGQPPQQPQPAGTGAASTGEPADPFKDFPADVSRAGEFYTLPETMLPEGVTLPEGTSLVANTAMLEAALPVLHKHKIPREAFQELVKVFNAHELADFQNGRAYLAEANKELGPGAEAVRKELATAMRQSGADFADEFAAVAPAYVVTWLRSVLARSPGSSPVGGVEQRWYGGRG